MPDALAAAEGGDQGREHPAGAEHQRRPAQLSRPDPLAKGIRHRPNSAASSGTAFDPNRCARQAPPVFFSLQLLARDGDGPSFISAPDSQDETEQAVPRLRRGRGAGQGAAAAFATPKLFQADAVAGSEEHTSEL